MFDYHAGEKYKLTLIMVGVAGFVMGLFISVIVIGEHTAPVAAQRQKPKWADHPDVTGKPRADNIAQATGGAPYATDGVNTMPPGMESYNPADEVASLQLIEQWLPKAWDLSAGSANQSQEEAIMYMTADCAAAYRQNIWTNDMANQVQESGLQSNFAATSVSVGSRKQDGSVVILVQGEQVLQVPGKGQRARHVNIEYLVKKTADGLRIAGISEGNQTHGS